MHLPGEVVVDAGVAGLLPVPLVGAQSPEIPLHLLQRLRVVEVAFRRRDGVEEFLLIEMTKALIAEIEVEIIPANRLKD